MARPGRHSTRKEHEKSPKRTRRERAFVQRRSEILGKSESESVSRFSRSRSMRIGGRRFSESVSPKSSEIASVRLLSLCVSARNGSCRIFAMKMRDTPSQETSRPAEEPRLPSSRLRKSKETFERSHNARGRSTDPCGSDDRRGWRPGAGGEKGFPQASPSRGRL